MNMGWDIDQYLNSFAPPSETKDPEFEGLTRDALDGKILAHFDRMIEYVVLDAVDEGVDFSPKRNGVVISGKELNALQHMVDQIRNQVNTSASFSKEHRERILGKLRSLQNEIHKPTSNYGKIYGYAVDVMGLAATAGETAMPIISETRKLIDSTTRLVCSLHGYPVVPLLPAASERSHEP